ncbi:pre-mRNA-splicing factor Syf2-like [Lutzomyia longipalpis]|uniref:pre-mRNA-splicing factor Syf2-like n=1 Tax=Lutzomyia longipalpis TaxID=7200 RepID=UPI0024837240|nr:pre-mRNA-splicing factor Syf2-like [Lutzomyia longipalpis]
MEKTKENCADKLKERMERLKKLHDARNQARVQNQQEVIVENNMKKLPANWEARKRKTEWLVAEEAAKDRAAAEGKDYERVKMLGVSVGEAEIALKKKRKGDGSFSSYEAQTARQYERSINILPPCIRENYEAKKRSGEEEEDTDPLRHLRPKDSAGAIDNMVEHLQKQLDKKKNFSRRRTHNDDADIDYINEKNARFNRKLERFYGEHTVEIKKNLERGTAV